MQIKIRREIDEKDDLYSCCIDCGFKSLKLLMKKTK